MGGSRCAERGMGAAPACTTARPAPEAFDLVVSNADVHHTYSKLYGRRRARRAARLKASTAWTGRCSLFVLYFGTDRTYRDEVVHHTVVFGPRYERLLRDIFHGTRLPDDFSLYLHAPQRH